MKEIDEITNLNQDDVLDLIQKFPIQPLFNKVIITLNMENYNTDLVISESSLSEIQYVLAVGPMSEQYLSRGQKVIIDLEKMTVKEQSDHDVTQIISRVKIDPILVDNVMFAIIEDRFIKAKDNRDE